MPPAPELRPAVAALLAEFLRHLTLERGRSAHTVRAYRADLEPLLAGLDDVAALDLATLRRWLAAGHAANASRSTLARRAAAARTFTGWAHRTGHLADDPGVRLVSPRPRPALPTVLGPEQAAAILNAAGTGAEEGAPLALRDLAVLELLYATGVRVAELCGLDLDDVDPQSAFVARARQGLPGAHGRLRRPGRGGPRPLAHGRPSAAREARSPPALLLGARGSAWTRGWRAASCTRRRARCPACRTSRRTVSGMPPRRT